MRRACLAKDVRRRNTEQSPDQERASNDYDTVDQAGLYVLAAKYGDVITQRGLKEERRNSCGDIFFALGRTQKSPGNRKQSGQQQQDDAEKRCNT